MEDLRRLQAANDGIVFDDMTFLEYKPEVIIALLSVEIPRTIPARYGDLKLPALVPLIFTTNVYERLFPRAHDAEIEWFHDDDALRDMLHQLTADHENPRH
ncbi:MAG: hypothetical protein AAF368_13710, partial [Planctomycetota bacterium]